MDDIKFSITFLLLITALSGCTLMQQHNPSNSQAPTSSYSDVHSEELDWESVENTTSTNDLQLFIAKYPDGSHVNKAKLRLKLLARGTISP